MRILFALPYGPTETRVRSRSLLEELSRRHEIELIALAWDDSDRQALADWYERGLGIHSIDHTMTARMRGLAGSPLRPLQQMVSASKSFATIARGIIHRASTNGRPFDVVHVEHLRGAAAIDLTAGLPVRTVFDAVDCIAELARLTAAQANSTFTRQVARFELARTVGYEHALVRAADVVTVVAERDRRGLQAAQRYDHIEVVPNGVRALDQPVPLTDEPIAVFTGKLSYHANQAAVRALLDNLWPHIKGRVPEARLVIAGASPPQWLIRRQGRLGVSVVANPAEMAPIIASSRVALAPMTYSVGIQNKVLEAMGCGVPVVATSQAVSGLRSGDQNVCLQADAADAFVELTVRALSDAAFSRELGVNGHRFVRQHYSWDAAARAFEALYERPRRLKQVA